MKREKILNKDGVAYTTQEGLELIKHVLELGDEFLPVVNKVFSKDNEFKDGGKTKIVTNYSVLASVKNYNNEEPVYISLTPSQASTITKKIDEGQDITQKIFNSFGYTNKYGDQIGVGYKPELRINKKISEYEYE